MLRSIFVFALIALLAIPALAQTRRNRRHRYVDTPKAYIEGTVGAMSSDGIVSQGKSFSGGFNYGLYPMRTNKLLDKFSVRAGFSFSRPFSQDDYNYGIRFKEQVYSLSLVVGYDVIRTTHIVLTPYFGGTYLIDRFSALLPGDGYYYNDMDVCGYFEGLCETRANLLGTAGISAKYFPSRDKGFYMGGDYSKFGDKKKYAATIGYRW